MSSLVHVGVLSRVYGLIRNIVFSCSILHEVTPMLAGRRYCCLPFLYDEPAAELRRRNATFLADDDLRRSLEISVRR